MKAQGVDSKSHHVLLVLSALDDGRVKKVEDKLKNLELLCITVKRMFQEKNKESHNEVTFRFE